QKDMHLASVSAYESGVAMPLTNAAKEIYRLAMREGHATQDFSAVYDYLTNNHDSATIGQKLTDSAKAQPHHANSDTSFYEASGLAYTAFLSATRFDPWCNRSRDRYANFLL